MDIITRSLMDAYRDLMDNKSDPRVNGWFMMSGPLPTALICLTYAYCVKVLGPKLMENRKPMDLRRVLIFYNLFQVIFSYWLFRELKVPVTAGRSIPEAGKFVLPGTRTLSANYVRKKRPGTGTNPAADISLITGWGGRYSFTCQPVDYSNNPLAVRMAHACWWYYISKFTEFFDTIFFVLRKKNAQVSNLHVIHHGIMPMSVWFGVKFTPGGHSTFFGLLNTFVHIVMYSYYLLAALGPKMQPYLWWKKYLTTLQMVQFVLVMVHAFQLLLIDCNYPKAFVWWIGMHAILFYFLFRDFYRQAYNKKTNDELKNSKKLQDNENIVRNGVKKLQVNGTTTENSIQNGVSDNKEEIYAGQYRMATGYISGNGLRNRVFIDNRSSITE